MKRNGIGVGSAFLTLIFVTLCLAVFVLISHASAENEMTLSIAEAELVKGYYEADARAAIIANELIQAEAIPENVSEVIIAKTWVDDEEVWKVEFSVPISQTRELYVKMTLAGDAYDILSWRIRDVNQWMPDTSIPVRRP